jgi:hypothetical protein
MQFRLDPSLNGAWTNTISAAASGAITWAAADHPHQAEYAANFFMLRTVSMGVRVLNIGTLVDRGGALYVAYSTEGVGTTTLDDLKLADETEVYDSARLEAEGLTAVWVPLSRTPVMTDAKNMDPTGSVYIDPAMDYSTAGEGVRDSQIFVWMEGTDGEIVEMEIEQVHNWEAIPYNANQFLFDRKAVVGSDSANAIARGTHNTPAVTTAVKSASSLGNHARSAATTVGKSAISQIESIALKGLSMLPGLIFSLFDMKKHRLSILLDVPELSPKCSKKSRDTKWEVFREQAIAYAARKAAGWPPKKEEQTMRLIAVTGKTESKRQEKLKTVSQKIDEWETVRRS